MNQTLDELTNALDLAQTAMMQKLQAVSAAAIVEPRSGWRVQDLVGHIAAWDWVLIEALGAHESGGTVQIIRDHAAFDQMQWNLRRNREAGQIYAEYVLAKSSLKMALRRLTVAKLAEPLPVPWADRRDTASRLVYELLERETEHRQKIAALIRS
ncbi:MAG: hypothetical protein OHK0023_08610 [Anaerolineae bacterium]